MLDRLTWLGHSGFVYQGDSATVYIDPFRVPEDHPVDDPADLLLITHCHYDHCSPEDIERIVTPDTVILCPEDCTAQLRGIPGRRKLVQVGSEFDVAGVRVRALPAYTRKSRLHGRGQGWVGYLIEDDGVRWYHAGDTDYIPEMKEIRADVACLPVSGGTVMTAVEAAAAAKGMSPGIAVPMHYGTIMGSDRDAELFRKLARSIDVRIPRLPD